MKYEKSCGAVIFRKTRGKYAVLLIKNRYADFWSFPKGHVEDGENEYQTAIREVKEETGIDIKIENGFRMESVYLIGKKKNIEKKVVYFASLTITLPRDVIAVPFLPILVGRTQSNISIPRSVPSIR